MLWCTYCEKKVVGHCPLDAEIVCNLCGKVLDDFNFSNEPTFVKNAAGQSQFSGNIVRTRESDTSASRERTLRRSREEILNMKDGLGIGDDRDDLVDIANRFYEIAVERNFTRGRRSEQVQASCLYLACREKNIPFLLIDFSNYLSINVYELGAVYLQLCEMLYLADNRNFDKLVDPSIFIPRFTSSLLQGGNKVVVKTARDIIASMKRDWMQTGRKPSGICGAALYIAALSHGLPCSKTDIVKIVHICEATLTKRLIEFENTEAGSLTIDEFTEREKELHNSSMKQPTIKKQKSGIEGVLCRHQNLKAFAYGLCEDCYDDFMKVSGGVLGGSDPPAFQRAERERIALAATKENTDESSAGSPSVMLVQSEQSNLEKELSTSLRNHEKLQAIEAIGTGDVKQAAVDGEDGDKSREAGDDAEALEVTDNFSDIDDVEVDGYLHNEEEKRFKKIIWEEMNKEYLEEQAAKEAALTAARKAFMANYENCPGDLDAARNLAEATAAAVAQTRKERQQKRAAELKNSAPAKTAAEATRQMLSRKRFSSKINYDAIDKLFETSVDPENSKKRHLPSSSDNDDDNDMSNTRDKMRESELTNEDSDLVQGEDDTVVDYNEEPDYGNVNEEDDYGNVNEEDDYGNDYGYDDEY